MSRAQPPGREAAQRHSLWQIFRMPLLLTAMSIVGLVSALVGDGAWDALSWAMLGIPIVLLGWWVRPGRGR